MHRVDNYVIHDPHTILALSDFDFDYPEDLVAHHPLKDRDQSRLLIRQTDGMIRHSTMSQLPVELPLSSCLIFNDSKVFPSRLEATLPTGGRVEVFLIEETSQGPSMALSRWWALGRPLRKLKKGVRLTLAEGLEGEVQERRDDMVLVEFNRSSAQLSSWLDRHGYIPLPPYIKRAHQLPACESTDRDRYQTVYAKERGSVAAPTAGLHFTEGLLKALEAGGVELGTVSLHVGAGTFLPVKNERIADHHMHREQYHVPLRTLEMIATARSQGRPVIAVGTTSLRSLEDLYRSADGDLKRMRAKTGAWQTTGLFVYPESRQASYRPGLVDGIITNFHQPKSTLFMLISALIGLDAAQSLYQAAFRERYRLFSYGDASLLWF